MDQLKRRSIPLEMLRFSNQASYPHLGHPTRSVYSTPHDIHYIRCMNMAQSKCRRPWKVSAVRPPRTYTTSNIWTWPKASAKDPGRSVHFSPHKHTHANAFPTSINIPFPCHSQHKYHLVSMTLSIITTTSCHIHIFIIIITIIMYQLNSSISASTINRILHIDISFMPEIHTHTHTHTHISIVTQYTSFT